MERRVHAFFAVMIVVSATLAGCNSSDNEEAQETIASIQGLPTSTRGKAPSEEQAKYLTDGVVTQEELTEAYEAAVVCINHNIPREPAQLTAFRTIKMGLSAGEVELSEADQLVHHVCVHQHVDPLADIYDVQNRLLGTRREDAFKNLQECLETYGTLPDTIFLGQAHQPMMDEILRLNSHSIDGAVELAVCIAQNSSALWPETNSDSLKH